MGRRISASALFVAAVIICGTLSCDDNTSEPGLETLGSFVVTAPDTVRNGTAFPLTVVAVGEQGTRPFTSFSGDVELTLSGGSVSPDHLTLSEGTGTIDVVLNCGCGLQTLTARGGGKRGSATLDVSLLSAIPGDPGDPVEGAIPEFGFAAIGDYYSTGHPELAGAYLSHEIVILVFTLGTTVADANALLVRHGASIVGGLTGVNGQAPGILFLRLPTATHVDMESALDMIRGDSHVLIAVQDVLVGSGEIPGANVGNQTEWSWDPTPFGGNWGLELCRVPQMWNLNGAVRKSGHPVMTGILDSGFDDTPGDIVYFNLTPGRESSHGTKVAGIIAATYDNGRGIDGINPFSGLTVKAVELSSVPPATVTFRISAGQAIISDLYSLAKTYNLIQVFNVSLGYNWFRVDIDGTNNPAARAIAYTHGALLEQALNLLSFFRPLPIIIAAAGNESNKGFGIQEARFCSPMANAALEHGVENIIVVEAVGYQAGSGTGDAVLADFSGVDGDISAPGVDVQSMDLDDACTVMSGTSFSAPFVAGVIGYLLCLDPGLTIGNIREILFLNGLDVGNGGSDRVDAWASAIDIDRIRGNTDILRMLCDIDDGTPDGNLRVDYENGVDFTEEDADGDGGIGDGSVDMSDFRRWRDWWLYIEGYDPALDGAADHIKRDVNGDGVVASPAGENLYPRGDFNGDGVLHPTVTSYVPGAVGGDAADLDVFREVFDDPYYEADDLPELIESTDVTFNCAAALGLTPGPIEVAILDGYDQVIETRVIPAGDPVQVFTVSRNESSPVISLIQGGWTVPYDDFGFFEDTGLDHYLRPLLVADIAARAGFLHTCGESSLSPVIVRLADLDLHPGDVLHLRVLGGYDGAIGRYGDQASGIFSSSDVLLDQSNLHRVPGAIQADTNDDPTEVTYECGGEPTDIPEDFRINRSLIVEIPTGATHLFIGVADCWYSDNTEYPDGYAVYLTELQKNGL